MFNFAQRWSITNILLLCLDCLVHLIFQQDRKRLQFWWYIIDLLVSKARFPKIFFSTNLRVNQWKNKTGAYDRWSVNHNSAWIFVVKPVTVTLSPERNRNMVTLSQFPKQKLLCLIPASLSWSPAASVEGLDPHTMPVPSYQTPVTVPRTLK